MCSTVPNLRVPYSATSSPYPRELAAIPLGHCTVYSCSGGYHTCTMHVQWLPTPWAVTLFSKCLPFVTHYIVWVDDVCASRYFWCSHDELDEPRRIAPYLPSLTVVYSSELVVVGLYSS